MKTNKENQWSYNFKTNILNVFDTFLYMFLWFIILGLLMWLGGVVSMVIPNVDAEIITDYSLQNYSLINNSIQKITNNTVIVGTNTTNYTIENRPEWSINQKIIDNTYRVEKNGLMRKVNYNFKANAGIILSKPELDDSWNNKFFVFPTLLSNDLITQKLMKLDLNKIKFNYTKYNSSYNFRMQNNYKKQRAFIEQNTNNILLQQQNKTLQSIQALKNNNDQCGYCGTEKKTMRLN